ncbi:hypothetical protein P4H66_19650 [Paenibacillus dokdonensis]|uniref:Uncharacterized protein n=1 Tax=Paenibacillus dokdonensis TaxID=2567944 RepID=A0ABU6GUL4_9BACL|nr:hypothetical protein [Paenibacillus dokdonensis]MEC0242021.1 hypothetical protein [Paenibacillus dokdonensis]
MVVNFDNKDLLFIYGHFTKKIKKLQMIKESPNNPIHESSINQELKLFLSITTKIEDAYPEVKKLSHLM